jgi:hypothetical protein
VDDNGPRPVSRADVVAASKKALFIIGPVVALTFVWVSAWLIASPSGFGWAFVALLLLATVATLLSGQAWGRARRMKTAGLPLETKQRRWLTPVLAGTAAVAIVVSQLIGRSGESANGIVGVVCIIGLAWISGMLVDALRSVEAA